MRARMIESRFQLTDETAVGLFGAVNLGLTAFSRLVDNIGPVLHDLLTAGQCAVAVVTVIYIWRKSQTLKRKVAVKTKKKKKVIRY